MQAAGTLSFLPAFFQLAKDGRLPTHIKSHTITPKYSGGALDI